MAIEPETDDYNYSELKPIRGETKYVEWEEYFQHWGCYGSDSGFCYATFCDKSEADQYIGTKTAKD